MHEYHGELSDYAFRANLARGRNSTCYYSFDDCDMALRGLHVAAVALAKESGVDVATDGLTPLGWSMPSADELRQNIAATRRVMDALRFAHVDYASLQGRFSLSAFLLDADTWCCQILEAEKIVACRWNPNYVGAN